ncbi:MAG: hypothetical protein Q8N47_05510 [Bryobacterales bacterium]|nr:hypothetical protein [Bryobacterales bacterium]
MAGFHPPSISKKASAWYGPFSSSMAISLWAQWLAPSGVKVFEIRPGEIDAGPLDYSTGQVPNVDGGFHLRGLQRT